MSEPGERSPEVPVERVLAIIRRALREGAGGQGSELVALEGVDETGQLVVAVDVGESICRLRVPDLPTLATIAGVFLKAPRTLDVLKLPYQPRTLKPLPVVETAAEGAPVTVFRAGATAQDMEGIEAVRGAATAAAVYTSRGPTWEDQGIEYKPLNEDGVVLFVSPGNPTRGVPEYVAIGAFDQAGGEGSVAESHGAASAAAGRAFLESAYSIMEGASPEQALCDAVLRASRAVNALEVGAVSTFAAAVIVTHWTGGVRKCVAHVAVVGDSRVLVFDRSGAIRYKTALHNLGAQAAAGGVPDIPSFLALQFASALARGLGTPDDTPDVHSWELAPGDRLVVETDGIGDARELEESEVGQWHADLCAQDQARVVGSAESAAKAVYALAGYALDQMADRYGKPDNVALGIVEVIAPTEPAEVSAAPVTTVGEG